MTLTRSKSAGLFASDERVRLTRGGQTCCVPGCCNNTLEDSHLQFYVFPTNLRRRILWLERIGRPQWIPNPAKVVCGNHFVGGNIRTSRGHMQEPTVFPRVRGKTKSADPTADSQPKRRLLPKLKSPATTSSELCKDGTTSLGTATSHRKAAKVGEFVSMAHDVLCSISMSRSSLKNIDDLKMAAEAAAEDHPYAQPVRNPGVPVEEEITIDGERRKCYKLGELPESQARFFCASMYLRHSLEENPQPLVNAGGLHIQLPPFLRQYLPSAAFLTKLPYDARIPLPSATTAIPTSTVRQSTSSSTSWQLTESSEEEVDTLEPTCGGQTPPEGSAPESTPGHSSSSSQGIVLGTSNTVAAMATFELSSSAKDRSCVHVADSHANEDENTPPRNSTASASSTGNTSIGGSTPDVELGSSGDGVVAPGNGSDSPSVVRSGSNTPADAEHTAALLSSSPTVAETARAHGQATGPLAAAAERVSSLCAATPSPSGAQVAEASWHGSPFSSHPTARERARAISAGPTPAGVQVKKTGASIIRSRGDVAHGQRLPQPQRQSVHRPRVVLSIVEEDIFPLGTVANLDKKPDLAAAADWAPERSDSAGAEASSGSDLTDFIRRVFVD